MYFLRCPLRERNVHRMSIWTFRRARSSRARNSDNYRLRMLLAAGGLTP